MTIHYELILLYAIGFKPKEVIKDFGYSRGTAYRFHRIFRLARKRAIERIRDNYSVSPEREYKVNDLGEKRKKKRVSHREKWDWKDNGQTVTATKRRET